MRVLLTPFSTAPHVYNVVPLAWALHVAGHEVRIAGHPDVTEKITGAGLTAVAVGDPLNIQDAIDEWPGDEFMAGLTDAVGLGLPEPTRTGQWLRMLVLGTISMYFCDDFPTGGHQRMVSELVDFAREWRPDLVLWDPVNLAGAVAAKASGAAHARLLFGHDLVGAMRLAFSAGPREDDLIREWLTTTLKRYDLTFDEEVILGQLTVDPMPSWMRIPLDLRSVPMRNLPYNGTAEVPEWLRVPASRPRVCLTLGVSQREHWGDNTLISDLVAAVAEHDVEVVATLNADQQATIGTVPPNVRMVDYVPLHALLPTCSAIIHHGGTGTYANAAVHGVPQLIIPVQLWDEQRIADAVVKRGAGLRIDAEELTLPSIKLALTRLLTTPSFRLGAAGIQDSLAATPAPSDIVPALERLAAGRR